MPVCQYWVTTPTFYWLSITDTWHYHCAYSTLSLFLKSSKSTKDIITMSLYITVCIPALSSFFQILKIYYGQNFSSLTVSYPPTSEADHPSHSHYSTTWRLLRGWLQVSVRSVFCPGFPGHFMFTQLLLGLGNTHAPADLPKWVTPVIVIPEFLHNHALLSYSQLPCNQYLALHSYVRTVWYTVYLSLNDVMNNSVAYSMYVSDWWAHSWGFMRLNSDI
jgi:hypothetical protein